MLVFPLKCRDIEAFTPDTSLGHLLKALINESGNLPNELRATL
jgi:hypothetical protein